jgi:hypothetical protein
MAAFLVERLKSALNLRLTSETMSTYSAVAKELPADVRERMVAVVGAIVANHSKGTSPAFLKYVDSELLHGSAHPPASASASASASALA